MSIKSSIDDCRFRSCIFCKNGDLGTTGSNTCDVVNKFSATDGPISCHFLHFDQTEDIWLKSALEGKRGVLLITERKS